jgi:Lon protease-like protein
MTDIPERDLPLFPLNTVLFPRQALPLHIFEPRYQELVTRCLRERIDFGVLLIKEGSEVGGGADPFMVGTSARIITVEELEDGCLDILAMGVARFRVLETRDDHPYMSGDIEILHDEMGDLARLPRLTQAAHRAYINYVAELSELMDEEERPAQIIAPNDPQVLSYTIASNLQISNSDQQALLEIETVQARLERELDLLESERGFLRRVKLMRETFARRDFDLFSNN